MPSCDCPSGSKAADQHRIRRGRRAGDAMAKTAPLSAEGRARQLAKEDRAPPRACAWCIETPPVSCALLRLLFCDPNSFHSALVQALVDSTRGRGERPHLLLASRHVRSDAGQDIFCRSARNFLTDLRCAPQEWTASASGMDRRRAIAERNGVAGGSALRRLALM